MFRIPISLFTLLMHPVLVQGADIPQRNCGWELDVICFGSGWGSFDADPFAFEEDDEEAEAPAHDEAMLRAVFTVNQALVALFAKADRDNDGLVLPVEVKQAAHRYPALVDALELPYPDALLAGLEDLIPSARVSHGELTELLKRQRERPKFKSLLGRARRAPDRRR